MKQCVWVLDDIESNSWEADCKHFFSYPYSGTTPDNLGVKYCPYCGGEVFIDKTGWIENWDKYSMPYPNRKNGYALEYPWDGRESDAMKRLRENLDQ